jgi:two-component system, LytTR family, sensor histidine kinase AlgZ
MNAFLYNNFIFSSRYRIWRHVIYWLFHISIWSAFWVVVGPPLGFGRYMINMIMWVPLFIFFSYPLVYLAIPHLLLEKKILQFFLVIVAWGAAGLYFDIAYRSYVLIPAQEAMGLENILPRGPLAFCYLCMTTSAASPMIIKFFKLWTVKQQQWMHEQEEKTSAELQLLKAQVHPQFLFNALSNIYEFSQNSSSQTPGLILKLSSLLSYMLYDCKTEEVRLEKEIENMKNYIDLEKERHGNKVEVSWSVEGDIEDKMVAPLLFLPFLENAFKHGISEQIEKPWVGVDVMVNKGMLSCKIVNSKTSPSLQDDLGIGIGNVKKRLEFLYPGKHELKINDEGDFFVVNMQVQLYADSTVYAESNIPSIRVQTVPA